MGGHIKIRPVRVFNMDGHELLLQGNRSLVSSTRFQFALFRQSIIGHNLATVAVESVDLNYPQSIDIAHHIIQAGPTAPDEDSCVKVGIVNAEDT